MDVAPEGGGRNLGPRPMETILSGATACTAYDVLTHLKKKKQNVHSCNISVNAHRAITDPKVFEKIHIHFLIYGADIDENLVKKAIHLSKTKLGSGYKMLSYSAEITESYQIKES
jgi:putative redox protein